MLRLERLSEKLGHHHSRKIWRQDMSFKIAHLHHCPAPQTYNRCKIQTRLLAITIAEIPHLPHLSHGHHQFLKVIKILHCDLIQIGMQIFNIGFALQMLQICFNIEKLTNSL